MVYDRGKIKWASLMLPEHVERLREIFSEETFVKQPILSEDQRNQMEYTIQQALSSQETVQVTYFEQGYRYTLMGTIKKADIINHRITIENQHTYKEEQQSVANILAIEIAKEHEKP